MRSAKDLTNLFFKDLRHFNQTNYKTIANADLSKQDAIVHKSFSSVLTRYFIFREKHPEVSDEELRILYFKLKLDLVALYFAEFPDTTTDNLVAFQLELKRYIKERKAELGEDEETEGTSNEQATSISDIGLESDNRMQIEQQQESVVVAV